MFKKIMLRRKEKLLKKKLRVLQLFAEDTKIELSSATILNEAKISYIIIYELKKDGLLTSRWGERPNPDDEKSGRRKYYSITARGIATGIELQKKLNRQIA